MGRADAIAAGRRDDKDVATKCDARIPIQMCAMMSYNVDKSNFSGSVVDRRAIFCGVNQSIYGFLIKELATGKLPGSPCEFEATAQQTLSVNRTDKLLRGAGC